MDSSSIAVLSVLFSWSLLGSHSSATSFLSTVDRARLKQVFADALLSNDLASVHYAVLGYKRLGETIPKPQDLCKFLSEGASGAVSPESYYHVISTWYTISSCGTLPAATNIAKSANEVLEKDGSSVSDLYFASHMLTILGKKLPQPDKLIKSLQASLKKDDSIINLGYTFHTAALLGVDGAFALERVEDAIVQADEVDGHMLQFEGGLSVTALVLSGAYKLATVVNKPPPITGDQALKFTNYFLSRRSVQTSKGAHSLIDIITTLTANKYHLPVSVGLVDVGAVSRSQPDLSVRVSDLLGHPLPSPFTVTIQSATPPINLSNKIFQQSNTDSTIYTVNIVDGKPEAGLYKVTVSATPTKQLVTTQLVGNTDVVLPVKVMADVSISYFEIGSVDADQTSQPELQSVEFPVKMSQVLEVDSQQRVIVRFQLKDKASGKVLSSHQAFVRFVNIDANQEIFFIAEPDTAYNYKLDLDIGSKSGMFGHMSGMYGVELIVGDAAITNSFVWRVAEVRLKLAQDPPTTATADHGALYEAKPEIKHLFREPERRPPPFVSNLFTGIVIVPFIVLLVLWSMLGVNISNFPFSLSAIGFHLGLGAIFGLFGLFWLQLNMFETLKYLLGLGVVTFLCGNSMLSSIANKRKHQ